MHARIKRLGNPSSRGPFPLRSRPTLERLESRTVPASLSLSSGVLSFRAAVGEQNQLHLDQVIQSGTAYIRIQESGPNASLSLLDSNLFTGANGEVLAVASLVQRLDIQLDDQIDTISMQPGPQWPSLVNLLAFDSVGVDAFTLAGTGGPDQIVLEPYRFPGDFNNSSPALEDGQKALRAWIDDVEIRILNIPQITVDIQQGGSDVVQVDRQITGSNRPVQVLVVGDGHENDQIEVTARGNLGQHVTLVEGVIEINNAPAPDELMLGRSDNIAIDQPRVVIEVIEENPGQAPESLGPEAFNTLLLDTGASGVLFAAESTSELMLAGYQTEGIYYEQGVAGFTQFDVSKPYRLDFAGYSGERNTLNDIRMMSSLDVSFSFFGPWGIVGMPAMVNRIVNIDWSRWSNIQDIDDLSMRTEFSLNPMEDTGHLASTPLTLVEFPASGQVPGNPVPSFSPLPHIQVKARDEGYEANGEFLLDTGAQLSIISTDMAMALGLDKDGDGTFDMEALGGVEVGGIGGTTVMPILAIDRVSVPTDRGDLVWTDLLVGVLDIEVEEGPSIQGVFGMDFLTSGWAAKVLPQLTGEPATEVDGYFRRLDFDFRQSSQFLGQLTFDLSPEHDVLEPANPNTFFLQHSGIGGVKVITDLGDDHFDVAPSATVSYSLEGGEHDQGDELALSLSPGVHAQLVNGQVQIPGFKNISIHDIEITGLESMGPQIIDDGDIGWASTGFSQFSALGGYQGDSRFANAGAGEQWATWTFATNPGDTYRVSTTWAAHANRAPNAKYQVYVDGNLIQTVQVDQRVAPGDFLLDGRLWEDLKPALLVSGSSLVIRLSNAATGVVSADAVRVESLPPPPPPILLDDGDAGWAASGFSQLSALGGYQGDSRFANAGAGEQWATWTFATNPGDTYRVSTTWAAYANRASNATYQIFVNGSLIQTIRINQRNVPGDFVADGGTWEDLLEAVTVQGSSMVVRLSNAANGVVSADAIRVQKILGSPLVLEGSARSSATTRELQLQELFPIVDEAMARWSRSSPDVANRDRLSKIVFEMDELPGAHLGFADSNRIRIDRNAAGHGWFLDQSPDDDGEFVSDRMALAKVDLLTVVMHEIGHVLGLEDRSVEEHPNVLMAEVLEPGTRRNPLPEPPGGEPTETTPTATNLADNSPPLAERRAFVGPIVNWGLYRPAILPGWELAGLPLARPSLGFVAMERWWTFPNLTRKPGSMDSEPE